MCHLYKVIYDNYYMLEEDNFLNGIIKSELLESEKYPDFYTNNINSALEYICKLLHVDLSNIVLNSCEQKGRVDVQYIVTNKKSDVRPSNKKFDAFRTGTINLYIKTYTFYIMRSVDNGLIYNDCTIKHEKFDSEGYFIEKLDTTKWILSNN